MQGAGHIEVLPETLQDGPEQVDDVVRGQGDEEQVERVPHRPPRQDETTEKVSENAQGAHHGLDDTLAPIGKLGQELLRFGAVDRTVQASVVIPDVDVAVFHRMAAVVVEECDEGLVGDHGQSGGRAFGHRGIG